MNHKNVISCFELKAPVLTITECFSFNMTDYIYICQFIYTILPKVLGHPLLMKDLTTLVISMSTNLNVLAYNDILGDLIF